MIETPTYYKKRPGLAKYLPLAIPEKSSHQSNFGKQVQGIGGSIVLGE